VSAVTAKPDLSSLHASLEEQVAEAAERLNVPGVAVGIWSSGDEDYVFHGVTSIENPLEVDASTLFQVGSTSKTYTATVLMILVEKGLVDLGAPVRTYVPELRLKDESVARAVTVLNLLNHTAGWTGDVLESTGEGDDALERFVEKLANVNQDQPLGTVASYNNAAFALAGRLIEKVTGKPFEVAVQELLLDPVGLKDSYYFVNDFMTRRFVVGHNEKDGKFQVARPWALPRSGHPAGGIVSTAADQIRYARFHLGDGSGKAGAVVLSQASLQRMKEPTFPADGVLANHVGISWLISDIDGVRVVEHGGTTNGQLSAFAMVPERDFAITVLTNAEYGRVLQHELVAWALNAYLGVREPEPVPLDLDQEQLAGYTGRFAAYAGVYDVSVDGDHLVIRGTYTDEGRRQAAAILGDPPPEPKPLRVRVLPKDFLLIIDGDAKGLKFAAVRDAEGRIEALNLGGRLVHRA